jgi:hypothetical protein
MRQGAIRVFEKHVDRWMMSAAQRKRVDRTTCCAIWRTLRHIHDRGGRVTAINSVVRTRRMRDNGSLGSDLVPGHTEAWTLTLLVSYRLFERLDHQRIELIVRCHGYPTF